MTTFEMLQELLAQNEFELLLPEDHTANTTEQDIRLVYQMNDTNRISCSVVFAV